MRLNRSFTAAVAILSIIMVALAAPGGAQSELDKSSIEAAVTDQDGNPVEDAKVTFQGPTNHVRYTDASGEALVEGGLETGTYKITAEKSGSSSSGTVEIDYEGDQETVSLTLDTEQLATLVDVRSSQSGGDITFTAELSRSVGSGYSCYWSKNDVVTEGYDNQMDKKSGKIFRDTTSTSGVSSPVWVNCFKDGQETNSEPVKHTFTVTTPNSKPDLNLEYPVGNEKTSENPTLRWDASDPDGDSLDSKVYVEKWDFSGDEPWNQPIIEEDVGSSESYFVSGRDVSGSGLNEGQRYVWGVRASDGVNPPVERISTFTVRDTDTQPAVAEIISEGPSGEVRNPVELFIRLDRSGDSYRCYWDYSHYVNRNSQRMTQVTDRRFEKDVNFDHDRSIYFQCFRKTDGAATNTVSTRFHFPPDDDEAPTARLDVNPDPATAGQTVTFDATDSSANGGSITEYWFDIDGNGVYEVKNNQDGDVRRTFSSPRSRTAKVKVFDSEGLSDTATNTYTVQESTAPSCNIDVGTLNVHPLEIDSGDSTTADINVYNNLNKAQTVKVRFEADSQSTTLTRDISASGQRTFEKTFTLDSDSDVTATVMTEGDSCGSRTIAVLSKGINVRSDNGGDGGDDAEDSEATLDVDVEDEDGDDLEDARVEVSNGDDEVDYTDEDGDARFTLEPGDYEVEVSRNGYRTETRDIDLDDGESEDLHFNLEKERDELSISAVSYNDNVCHGSDLRVQVIVENTRDREQSVELSGSGLGSETRASFSVPSEESRVRTLVFPDVQREDPGTEQTFRITLQNGDYRSVTRTIEVQDCPAAQDAGAATGISLEASPQTVKSGEPVKVSGFVDGVNARKEVEIRVDGRLTATVNTAPDGYYQAFITPTGSGDKTVTVSTDSTRASRTIRVAPTASIDFVEAPDRVFQGETFQVCGRGIRSQVNARVFLLEDGEILGAKNGVGRVCFEVNEMEAGEHTYRIAVVAGNQRSVAEKKVEIMEMKEEASNFPDQVASVESGQGMVKVTLYNNHDSIKRYDLSLEGIPTDWTSQTEKQAVLQPGETREVFFYITPEEEGEFEAELKVKQGGTVIHQQTVRINSGGTTEPGKSLLERLLQRLRL
ncbi:MAG: carboxypeptidase regulatory-like domain-containing protein [Candidatus Nanohaloarchaea archaeon]